MESDEKQKQQVADAAKKFFLEHMSMKPQSIVVDIHPDCLVVTLHNAISRAETAYTKEKVSSELLDRFYKDTFDASRPVFETAMSRVSPRPITGSLMSLHPQSGKCVVVVSLCNDNAGPAGHATSESKSL
jgi:uncharacterized protein YbcI